MPKWYNNPTRIIGGDPDTIDLEVSYVPDGRLYVSKTWCDEDDVMHYLRRQPSIGVEEVVECPDLILPILIWLGAMAPHTGFDREITVELQELAHWALEQTKAKE